MSIAWQKYGIDDTHDYSMDARHAEFVKAAIKALRPQTVVEVGCHLGISTLAILEAGVPDVRLIDMQITASVLSMAEDYRAVIYEELSHTALPKIQASENMVVLLDGNHSWEVVSEEARILNAMNPLPRAIICHDVTNRLLGLGSYGCWWLWHALQACGWLCFVDALPRDGERTDRGLMIATRSLADHAAVVSAYSEINK